MITFPAIFNNKRSSVASLSLVASADYGNSTYGSWGAGFHPSTSYVAVAGNDTDELQAFSFTGGNTLTQVEALDLTSLYSVVWSRDGDFLFIGYGNTAVKAYSWNGSDTLAEVESVAVGGYVTSIAPDSDDSYVAVGSNGNLYVYSWNGSDTLANVETVASAGYCYRVAWNPTFTHLAVASDLANKQLRIFSWNGSDTLAEVEVVDAGFIGYSVCWSTDGNYVFFGGNSSTIYAYSWNGSDTLTEVETGALTAGRISRASFLFYENNLICGEYLYNSGSSSVVIARAFTWNGSDTLTSVSTISAELDGPIDMSFNSDYSYIALGCGAVAPGVTTNRLQVASTGL